MSGHITYKHRFIIYTLILILSIGSFNGYPIDIKAATASYQTDEYGDTIADYIEKTLNTQLIAALSKSNGTKAKIVSSSYNTYKSEITFTLKNSRIGAITPQRILDYVSEAIYNNPNLCTLSTHIYTSTSSSETKVTVFSLVAKSSHAKSIRAYKTFLADIEALPKTSATMSETDMLLYIHDRLVQQAHYTLDESDKWIFIPFTMSKNGKVVCQSYAAVLNHLMRDLGYTSYAVTSKTHAWDIVKLNGKWYAIDATWDDPTGKARDYVSHDYFLVSATTLAKKQPAAHMLDTYSSMRFGSVGSKYGSAYNTYLPKSKNIITPMCYSYGSWFYASGGEVYRWDGTSNSAKTETAIEYDKNRCVGEVSGELFVGGSDGVYKYDPMSTLFIDTLSTSSIQGLFYHNKALYRRSGSTWTAFIKNEPDYTYEDLNGTANKEVISLIKPAKPTVTAKKSSAKSIRVSVTKQAKDANAGYQVQYSLSSAFSNKVSVTTSTNSVSLTKLTKGSTYYVRVRGIYKTGSYKKYGTYSAVKKVKL